MEAAASEVNQHPELAVSVDFARSVKKDVHQIVEGPCPEDPTYYILAGQLLPRLLDVHMYNKVQ